MAAVKFRPKLRLMSLLLLFGAGLATVAARLVWVQGMASGRYSSMAAAQRERRYTLPPQRGSIFDRQHAELAMSMDMKTVYANPPFIPDKKAAAAALAPIIQQAPEAIEAKLNNGKHFVYLARKIDEPAGQQVKGLGIPGIGLLNESKRFYPAGSLAAHVLGFVGIDNQGLGGLEHQYDKVLQGKPGELAMERDPRGRAIPSGKSHFKPPTEGYDLELTLDREIQFVAEDSLHRAVQNWGAKGGTIIVMAPKTGEILALANYPTFDPNDVRATPPEARRNRALGEVYEPGSTSKVITAAAALELGVIKEKDVLNVPDKLKLADDTFHDHTPHPTVDLTFAQVIQQSSNVGTIKVALKVGKNNLHEYLEKFGYGAASGLPFPGQSLGILPRVDEWWPTSLPTMAIGQGVAVTPLQIVGVYSTIANGGVAVSPKLVRGVVDSQGNVQRIAPGERRRVIKKETADRVTQLLVGVVEEQHATGHNAAVPGYQVAGKTGSAEKTAGDGHGYSGYMSSFIGFAPAADPELVVGVILDDPRPIWGGTTAAPSFREVMQFGLRHLGIGPGPVLQYEGTPLLAPVRSGGATPNEPDRQSKGKAATGAATD
jgi:cell division protein FtsI (penicillin-binding protein 3)